MLPSGMTLTMAAVPRVYLADPRQNAVQITEILNQAQTQGVQLCVFPELCLTGATCGDLLRQPLLLKEALGALKTLLDLKDVPAAIVGLPLEMEGRLYNCAVVFSGDTLAVVPKQHTDGHLFTPGMYAPLQTTLFGRVVPVLQQPKIACGDFTLSVLIGEDAFSPACAAAAGSAQIIACPAAQCELVTRKNAVCRHFEAMSAALGCAVVYTEAGYGESTTNAVFSGYAAIFETGKILAEKKRFLREAGSVCADVDTDRLLYRSTRSAQPVCVTGTRCEPFFLPVSARREDIPLARALRKAPFIPCEKDAAERLEDTLMIQAQGLIMRMEHIRAQKLVVGVSGGLDSTLALLVAALAYDRAGWDRNGIIGITMPGFGTGSRTKGNADKLMELIGCEQLTVPIGPAVRQHFADIGHDGETPDICYENSQARERTQIVMDYANKVGALALGTGDLSELALGWCTYNGDHMSMYNVNGTVPKTLIRPLVLHAAAQLGEEILAVVRDICDTPISPELKPNKEGELTQRTEDTLGAYALHDFFIYHMMDGGASPRKLYALACMAFAGEYGEAAILNALRTFVRRFFTQQFKRSCLPDGAKIGTISFSPRGDWSMPSDALMNAWLREVDAL